MERNELLSRITIDPEICHGRPTIRGKRITAQTILEFLSAGESREEILRQYHSLEPEDIDACLAFGDKLKPSPGPGDDLSTDEITRREPS